MVRQEVILGSAPYGLFRQGFVDVAAEDQNWDVGRGSEQLVEGLDPTTIGQRQFEQDSSNSFLVQARKTIGKLANPFHVERTAACGGKRRANPRGGGRIVFNKKYFRSGNSCGHYVSHRCISVSGFSSNHSCSAAAPRNVFEFSFPGTVIQ